MPDSPTRFLQNASRTRPPVEGVAEHVPVAKFHYGAWFPPKHLSFSAASQGHRNPYQGFVRSRNATAPARRKQRPDQMEGEKRATDPTAHLAQGVEGAQPPLEDEGAHEGHRHTTAAGLRAVYETAHFGFKEMGVKRTFQTLLKINQKDGFDCPSCAWPDPDGKRKMAEFCENGAKAVAWEATTKRVTPEVFASHPISEMLQQRDVWLEELGRITHPMVRRAGADFYEPISWDDAFALIGRELRALASPDEAAFYTSGRASNEAAFLYQLFARQFGTNNLPDCSNMCHESSGAGLTETIGIGKATVRIDDFAHADAIFVIGQNPGHLSSADVERTADGRAQRLQNRQRQSAV